MTAISRCSLQGFGGEVAGAMRFISKRSRTRLQVARLVHRVVNCCHLI